MAGNSNSGGRNAKSPEEHRAQGTFQKVRHDGYEIPDPPPGIPEPPMRLEGLARQEWDNMVGRLQASGTLKKVDDAAVHGEFPFKPLSVCRGAIASNIRDASALKRRKLMKLH